MSSESLHAWLDEQEPYDADASAVQIASLLGVLREQSVARTSPLRVLELGCGAGRVVQPLAAEGYEVVGIERNAAALSRCRAALEQSGRTAVLLEQDFLSEPWPEERFDAIVCMGNTFMTIVDLDAAVEVLRKTTDALADGGIVILDDLPGEFWPELTEGNWQAGISEDGTAQMVWDPRDSVFVLRSHDEVDLESWQFKAADRPLRLWTSSTLSLACRLAGLSEPAVHPGLLVMKHLGERGNT